MASSTSAIRESGWTAGSLDTGVSPRARFVTALAACLLLVLAAFGIYGVYQTPSAYVDIDVNPAIVERIGGIELHKFLGRLVATDAQAHLCRSVACVGVGALTGATEISFSKKAENPPLRDPPDGVSYAVRARGRRGRRAPGPRARGRPRKNFEKSS